MAEFVSVKDSQIKAPVVDYSRDYPQCKSGSLGSVTYAQLKSGSITIKGKQISTAGLSSYFKARQICQILKQWIESGKFLLSEPVAPLPSVNSGVNFKGLKERKIK